MVNYFFYGGEEHRSFTEKLKKTFKDLRAQAKEYDFKAKELKDDPDTLHVEGYRRNMFITLQSDETFLYTIKPKIPNHEKNPGVYEGVSYNNDMNIEDFAKVFKEFLDREKFSKEIGQLSRRRKTAKKLADLAIIFSAVVGLLNMISDDKENTSEGDKKAAPYEEIIEEGLDNPSSDDLPAGCDGASPPQQQQRQQQQQQDSCLALE